MPLPYQPIAETIMVGSSSLQEAKTFLPVEDHLAIKKI